MLDMYRPFIKACYDQVDNFATGAFAQLHAVILLVPVPDQGNLGKNRRGIRFCCIVAAIVVPLNAPVTIRSLNREHVLSFS